MDNGTLPHTSLVAPQPSLLDPSCVLQDPESEPELCGWSQGEKRVAEWAGSDLVAWRVVGESVEKEQETVQRVTILIGQQCDDRLERRAAPLHRHICSHTHATNDRLMIPPSADHSYPTSDLPTRRFAAQLRRCTAACRQSVGASSHKQQLINSHV